MSVRTSIDTPIRVDWVAERLGLTFAPGKQDASAVSDVVWRRDLALDLDRLATTWRCDVLVSLVEEHELAQLGIADLAARAAERDLELLRFPIRDGRAPERLADARALVSEIRARLAAGRTVVVHCRGGLGRAGTIGAACLVAEGLPPEEAIARTRAARPGAIETEAQERFVRAFAAS